MTFKSGFVDFSRAGFRLLFRMLGGFHVYGLEHIPPSGAVILAPNHLSWADPPVVRVSVTRTTWFMAGDFLFKIPILGALIPYYGAFPVHREKLDREAIRTAEQHLKDGDILCVFPEGGTSLTGRLMPLEGGVALLALRNNVPIVPAAIWGTEKVLPNEHQYPHFARGGVNIRYGPPLFPGDVPTDLPRKERTDELTRRLYAAVAALLPPEYAPPPEQEPLAAPAPRTEGSPAGHDGPGGAEPSR